MDNDFVREVSVILAMPKIEGSDIPGPLPFYMLFAES